MISPMKQLVVEMTSPGAASSPIGPYKVAERRPDGSLVLIPESAEEVIADVADRALSGEEFLAALDRLDLAASSPPA
jgi:hypothetical protein